MPWADATEPLKTMSRTRTPSARVMDVRRKVYRSLPHFPCSLRRHFSAEAELVVDLTLEPDAHQPRTERAFRRLSPAERRRPARCGAHARLERCWRRQRWRRAAPGRRRTSTDQMG